MDGEQRKADRFPLPTALQATVDDVPVRLLDLSIANATVEHEQRFPLESPRLRLQWNRSEIHLPFRVMRSERVPVPDGEPLYRSGIEFVALEPVAVGLIASILQWAQQSASRATEPRAQGDSLEDTWIRKVKKLRNDRGE